MTVPDKWPNLKIPTWSEAMLDLLACACEAVEVIGAGPTCWCGIYPGESVSWEACGDCGDDVCGMVYIRPSSVYPSDEFPSQAFDANCLKPLAYELELGILRCFPTMDEEGNLPPDEVITEAALLMVEDQRALFTSIACCESDLLKQYVLGSWTPVGPAGGCHGGFWTLYVDPNGF